MPQPERSPAGQPLRLHRPADGPEPHTIRLRARRPGLYELTLRVEGERPPDDPGAYHWPGVGYLTIREVAPP